MKNIYLIGFMGVGKSTVAAELHRQTGWDVYDTDALIEEEEGMSIPEIFETYGEAHFRSSERRIVASLTAKEHCIVSCGGGVAAFPENVEEIKRGGTVVYLTAAPGTILSRVKEDDNRPLLAGRKNEEGIAGLLGQRMPMYEAAGDITVATDGRKPIEIAKEILAALTF